MQNEAWRGATPLERVRMQPELPKDLRTELYTRTEQRGLAMLLKALPTVLRTQLVAERQLSSTAVLYKLLVVYQPGGSGEKSLILLDSTEGVARMDVVVRGTVGTGSYVTYHVTGSARATISRCIYGNPEARVVAPEPEPAEQVSRRGHRGRRST